MNVPLPAGWPITHDTALSGRIQALANTTELVTDTVTRNAIGEMTAT